MKVLIEKLTPGVEFNFWWSDFSSNWKILKAFKILFNCYFDSIQKKNNNTYKINSKKNASKLIFICLNNIELILKWQWKEIKIIFFLKTTKNTLK